MASPPDQKSLLKRWAAQGKAVIAHRTARGASWDAISRMDEASRPFLLANARVLRSLLLRWNEIFSPLADPLLEDFGVHRWLSKSREEAYSDWLSWVVENLERPTDLLRLFDVRSPGIVAVMRRHHWTTNREVCIDEGHPGHKGRLDLDVVIQGTLLIQVEVKLFRADVADTGKQVGYRHSARTYAVSPRHRFRRLVAKDAEEDEYPGGYQLVSWQHIAAELRRNGAWLLGQHKVTKASMFLGFAGAIEQNLLEFSNSTARKAFHEEPVPVPSAVVYYLESALAKVGGW